VPVIFRPNFAPSTSFTTSTWVFLNRRLCITALRPIRAQFLERMKPGTDHVTVLSNDHLLVTMLLDLCQSIKAPTLLEALTLGKPRNLFRSTERL